MSALLIKASLIISMAFGSAGGAAALAANSLPDSPLYPAKLAMEQTRLNATNDPAGQATLHMNLAGVRIQEMQRQALKGDVPDQASQQRLQTHLDQALQLAAGLPDDEMLDLLNQARQTIQNREQEMKGLQAHTGEPAQEPLLQANRTLNQVRQDIEAGLQDPQAFRWRHTHNRPPEAPLQPTGEPNPECPNGDCQPAGDQHQYGPGPEQPGPGAPAGNPDCPNQDCEPVGDQHQYGPGHSQDEYHPQPEQPGPGAPGGNPDCPSGDCEPST